MTPEEKRNQLYKLADQLNEVQINKVIIYIIDNVLPEYKDLDPWKTSYKQIKEELNN